MQTLRYKYGVASVSALLNLALLLVQLCGAICAFSSCQMVGTALSAKQVSEASQCHKERHAQSRAEQQYPQSPRNQQHKCADHETEVMMPVKDSLATAVVLFHFTPIVFEPFTPSLFDWSVAVGVSVGNFRRAPPRVPQRAILRI